MGELEPVRLEAVGIEMEPTEIDVVLELEPTGKAMESQTELNLSLCVQVITGFFLPSLISLWFQFHFEVYYPCCSFSFASVPFFISVQIEKEKKSLKAEI